LRFPGERGNEGTVRISPLLIHHPNRTITSEYALLKNGSGPTGRISAETLRLAPAPAGPFDEAASVRKFLQIPEFAQRGAVLHPADPHAERSRVAAALLRAFGGGAAPDFRMKGNRLKHKEHIASLSALAQTGMDSGVGVGQ